MIKLRDILLEGKMTTKMFVKAVNDEYDIESLELMQGIIDKRVTFLKKMTDTANPRKVVKGFRR